MKSDIEIARETSLSPIMTIAKKLGIPEDDVEQYGKYKAKVKAKDSIKGKLILVTAINPTSAGEGKTTVSIGLADSLAKLGENVSLALREPSLGPVFGIKGGAAGGGMAQIAPMDDINLHFTGDLHAITSANNLLSSMIDNHIHWGNALGFHTVTFRRCMDCNDRALRNIVVGLGGRGNGVPREDGFDITAASEIMATLCLASDLADLKARLARLIVGYRADASPITAQDLSAHEAMTILLKDAIKPNLVQTLEGVPAFVHGGPFANIAHGCNSVIATKTALSYSDYVVTEAGFGADLGAEKFLDIKCRVAGIAPQAVVIVATIRALKSSGESKLGAGEEDMTALTKGLENLGKHIENITKVYGLPCVVAINKFVTDTDKEINCVKEYCLASGAKVETAEIWAKGSEGGISLAKAVISSTNEKSNFHYCYEDSDTFETKIEKIATKIYGAKSVTFSAKAKSNLAKISAMKTYDNLPVCIAKTQYSLSDNPRLLGRPNGFDINVRDVALRAGAGFVVALAGDIMLMPGLSVVPSASKMSIDGEIITGLF